MPASDWFFQTVQSKIVQRDPAWDSYFESSDEIRSDHSSLVREAIQNSLDAADPDAEEPVLVRFAVGAVDADKAVEFSSRYFNNLDKHLDSCGLLSRRALLDESSRYLVVEDFNTRGLAGDQSTEVEPLPGQRNDFLYFFRRDARSGKQLGRDNASTRGRFGIGKYTFPMASLAYSVFGLTIRKGDPTALLMGRAILKHHDVDTSRFVPDGFWGDSDVAEDQPVLPTSQAGEIAAFRRDWMLSRQDAQPGLSVVVPFLGGNWGGKEIAEAVIEHYMVAICSGELEVEVSDSSAAFTMEITKDSISSCVKTLGFAPIRRDDLMDEMDLITNFFEGSLVQRDIKMAFDDDSAPDLEHAFAEDSLTELAALSGDLTTGLDLTLPLAMKGIDGTRHDTYVRVLIRAALGENRTTYHRQGLRIPKAGKGDPLPNCRAVVLAEDEFVSKFLNLAEGPAHLTWQATEALRSGAVNPDEKPVRHSSSWLTFIRGIASALAGVVMGSARAEDFEVSEEYFSVRVAEEKHKTKQNTTTKTTVTKPKGGTGGGVPISIDARDKELVINLEDKGTPPSDLIISLAYDIPSGDPLAKWTPFDFDLSSSSMKVTVSGAKIIAVSGNEISLSHVKASMKVRIRGLDPNRDPFIRLRGN